MEQSEVSFLSIPSWNPPRITPSSLKIDRITSLLLAIMNENEILATRQVQADGLNGKDAKETKQLHTVRGRSPNPAPDCFFYILYVGQEVRVQLSWPIFLLFGKCEVLIPWTK